MLRCSFCPMKCSKLCHLVRHHNVKHSDKPKPVNGGNRDVHPDEFSCPYCPKTYVFYESIYKHCSKNHVYSPRPKRHQFILPARSKSPSTTVSDRNISSAENNVADTQNKVKLNLGIAKGQLNAKKEPQRRSLRVARNSATHLLTVKLEPEYDFESAPPPFPVIGSEGRTNAIDSTETPNSLVKSQTRKNALNSAMVEADDDDFCMIVEPDIPLKREKVLPSVPIIASISSDMISTSRNQSTISETASIPIILNSEISKRNIEKSSLPLSAAIVNRAIQHPMELMVIWCKCLDDDLISAVSMHSAHCILCIENIELLKLSDDQREKIKKGDIISFNMWSSNDTFSLWTVITFGGQQPPVGLKNKLFRSFEEVERVFGAHAGTRGKSVTNLLRYSKDGLFPILSTKLSMTTMGFNCAD